MIPKTTRRNIVHELRNLGFFALFLSSTLLCLDISAQDSLQSLLKTDLDIFNLKGSVKEIKVTFERFFSDTLPDEIKGEYDVDNYFALRHFPLGLWQFNESGFLSFKAERFEDYGSSLLRVIGDNRSLIEYSNENAQIDIRKEIKGKYRFDFPVYDPYAVLADKYGDRFESIIDTELIYDYVFRDSTTQIVEETNWAGESIIMQSRKYFYNDRDQIVKQVVELLPQRDDAHKSLSMGSSLREGLYSHGGIVVSSLSDVYYTFSYDNSDRIDTVSIFVNEKLEWQESYFYSDSSKTPDRVDRFYSSHEREPYYYSMHKSEWYNEFGDPIKSENYNDNKKLIRTRYYDYVYDDQNNWIQCDMYLEGGVDKTLKPTLIMYREITYYD
jgi:hypothetical protein